MLLDSKTITASDPLIIHDNKHWNVKYSFASIKLCIKNNINIYFNLDKYISTGCPVYSYYI